MQATAIKNERGFTLVETMVALVVGALGILAVMSLFEQLSQGKRAAEGAVGFSDYVSLITSALAHPDLSLDNSCTNDLHFTDALPSTLPSSLSEIHASVNLYKQGSPQGSPLIANANNNQIQTSDGNIYTLTFSGKQVAQYLNPGHILPSNNQPAPTAIYVYHGNLTLQAERHGLSLTDTVGADLSANIPISLELDPNGDIKSCSTRPADTDLTPLVTGGTAHSANECYNLGGVPVQSGQGKTQKLICHFVDYTAAYSTGTAVTTNSCPEGFNTSGSNCVVQPTPEAMSVPNCPDGWTATDSTNTTCTKTLTQQGACPIPSPCPSPGPTITPNWNSAMRANGNTPTFDISEDPDISVYNDTDPGGTPTITPSPPLGSPIPATATCSVTTTCVFNTNIDCPAAPASDTSPSGTWSPGPGLGTCTYVITACPASMQQVSSSPLTCAMTNVGPTPFVVNNYGTPPGKCPGLWSPVPLPPGGVVSIGGINCQ